MGTVSIEMCLNCTIVNTPLPDFPLDFGIDPLATLNQYPSSQPNGTHPSPGHMTRQQSMPYTEGLPLEIGAEIDNDFLSKWIEDNSTVTASRQQGLAPTESSRRTGTRQRRSSQTSFTSETTVVQQHTDAGKSRQSNGLGKHRRDSLSSLFSVTTIENDGAAQGPSTPKPAPATMPPPPKRRREDGGGLRPHPKQKQWSNCE